MTNQIAGLRACLAQNYEPKSAIKDKTPRLFEAKEQDRTSQTNLYDHRIKKMKKLFKNVNVAGLAVVLMAAGVITTQSAFKSTNARENHLYGKQANGVWLDIDDLDLDATAPYTPGTYRCDGTTNKCTVLAPVQPPNGSNPAGATPGNFIINP